MYLSTNNLKLILGLILTIIILLFASRIKTFAFIRDAWMDIYSGRFYTRKALILVTIFLAVYLILFFIFRRLYLF